MEFISRILGLQVAGIGPAEAQTKLQQKQKPFLLDVRQPEEYRAMHIAGAKLIPLNELQQRMDELPKDREILCVCHSGNRSSSATRKLTAAGYEVTNLQGGMIAWTRAGLSVKKGKA